MKAYQRSGFQPTRLGIGPVLMSGALNHTKIPDMKLGRSFGCLLCIGFFGCAPEEATMLQTGPSRPAISPSDVKVYLVDPPKFEAIGMVNASDSSRFMSKEELQNSILLQLKTKAAKVGANGLIIRNTGSEEVAGNPYANFSK